MPIPLDPKAIEKKRGWIVHSVFEPLPFSPAYLRTLQTQRASSEAPGHSDVGTQNFLFSMILNLKPQSVLEVGGHIGSASLVIGEALRINGYGKLVTIEPQKHYFEQLTTFVRDAELTAWIEPLMGFSHEAAIRDRIRSEKQFDVIFIDACHDYEAVFGELDFLVDHLRPGGFFVLHDSTVHAQSFDSSGKGGVRKAIVDVVEKYPELSLAFFEYPLWLNDCGMAVIAKREARAHL